MEFGAGGELIYSWRNADVGMRYAHRKLRRMDRTVGQEARGREIGIDATLNTQHSTLNLEVKRTGNSGGFWCFRDG